MRASLRVLDRGPRLAEDILVEADLWRAAGARALDHLPLHARLPDLVSVPALV